MNELFSKSEFEERGGELVNRLVEVSAECKMGYRVREVVHWLVKFVANDEVGKRGRKSGQGLIENCVSVSIEGEMLEGERERVDWVIKVLTQFQILE